MLLYGCPHTAMCVVILLYRILLFIARLVFWLHEDRKVSYERNDMTLH
jgi:hypothetical protein